MNSLDPEMSKVSPRYTSVKQRRASEKKQFRLKADLTAEGTIHKDLQ